MNDIPMTLAALARQEQFLDVVDRDEAVRRFHRHLELRPLGPEAVTLAQAFGRVLAEAVDRRGRCPGLRPRQCRRFCGACR